VPSRVTPRRLFSTSSAVREHRAVPGAEVAYGYEIVPEAVADARRNARRNGITNAELLEGTSIRCYPRTPGALSGPPAALLVGEEGEVVGFSSLGRTFSLLAPATGRECTPSS